MATRRYNKPVNQEVSARYASDLTDKEFEFIGPHVAQKDGSGKKSSIASGPAVNGGCCRAIFRPGITFGIIIELGVMMAHGTTSTRFSAAMYGPRPVETPSQVLGLLTVKVSQRQKWVAKKVSTPINW